jgi:hypothetical protein
MKERPILMSAPMVRATLADIKTNTRRVIKPTWQPATDRQYIAMSNYRAAAACPYGQPGDLLWVRETWCDGYPGTADPYLYRATYEGGASHKWKPSIFMPRAASRLTLRITDVRAERVQDATPEDCLAEGITPDMEIHAGQYWREDARERFTALWDGINAKRGYGWAANPWVWVISFERA